MVRGCRFFELRGCSRLGVIRMEAVAAGDLSLFYVFVASLKGVLTILVTSAVIVGGLGFSMLRGCNNLGVIRKQITTGFRTLLSSPCFCLYFIDQCSGWERVGCSLGWGCLMFAIGWARRFYWGWVLQFLRVFAFLEGVVSWLGSVVLWVGHGIRVNCLLIVIKSGMEYYGNGGTIRRGCCWKDAGLEAMSFDIF
ncbi:hypothetical protein HanRHA438_Chr12g0570491 [Helianthus annuus]|uniref:Transmembrane protein n=1 Tax=Helianthus annuus TaxID=4232 RepID=A0A9K3MXJ3_HELAN|nr:hypothetical protein HanXRQr2_Chr12g0559181 [Helianthus annuus]KAJ0490679.1 hypothetical protein HanHA300_Chr12g0458291 [Helianthus annuus]KAJ0494969.1 hypothetical protein HanIR_Chr12g0603541 [Helianthus annuus]KAJ0506600.1 hypothetical protein HanHA89_Chr12g0483891 [Helianthus annuus]KAJ0629113.1 hypothetical protein HanIR_Chr00c25g0910731 [Helianthus annuus]